MTAYANMIEIRRNIRENLAVGHIGVRYIVIAKETCLFPLHQFDSKGLSRQMVEHRKHSSIVYIIRNKNDIHNTLSSSTFAIHS